jgi:hypothetical protein
VDDRERCRVKRIADGSNVVRAAHGLDSFCLVSARRLAALNTKQEPCHIAQVFDCARFATDRLRLPSPGV